MKNCTPLWREAHFQVKMLKTPHVRTTFGSWDDERVHAVAARSTFGSLKGKNLRVSDHFWKLSCWKNARRCGAKHISKSKCAKRLSVGALLEVEMFKKCTPLWISKSTCTKHTILGSLFEVRMCFRVAGTRDSAPGQKWEKHQGFVAVSKRLAGVGHLKRICKDAFRVAGAVPQTHEWRWFPERAAFWSIRSSGLLRWSCVTGAALRMTWHHFSWQAPYFTQMEWKSWKTQWYETVSSGIHVKVRPAHDEPGTPPKRSIAKHGHHPFLSCPQEQSTETVIPLYL